MKHAPLYYDMRIDGQVIAVCECGDEMPPHVSRGGALQALGEHIANPGGA